MGDLHETSETEWDRVMAVNVKGIYLASRHVVPIMIHQKSGSIINMSACRRARDGIGETRGVYCIQRRGLLPDPGHAGRLLPLQNIRVNSLLPGTIYTPFVEGFLETPPRRQYRGRN